MGIAGRPEGKVPATQVAARSIPGLIEISQLRNWLVLLGGHEVTVGTDEIRFVSNQQWFPAAQLFSTQFGFVSRR
jgi:hypothetical protein